MYLTKPVVLKVMPILIAVMAPGSTGVLVKVNVIDAEYLLPPRWPNREIAVYVISIQNSQVAETGL